MPISSWTKSLFPSLSRALLVRLALSATALAATPAVSGCGYLKANFAETYVWQRELDAYVFQQPRAVVVDKATHLRGPNDTLLYRFLVFTDVSPTLKRSDPKVDKNKWGGGEIETKTSYFEIESEDAPGGCRVRVFEVVQTQTVKGTTISNSGPSRDRRLDLELELVGAFDAATRARIEKEGTDARSSGEWYPPKKR